MVQMQTASKAVEVVLSTEIDVEEFLSLRHIARQCLADRRALEGLFNAFDSQAASLDGVKLRKETLCWALDKDIDKSVFASDDSALANMILCYMAFDEGDSATALAEAEKAIKKAPTVAACTVAKIKALRDSGKIDDAIAFAESVGNDFSDCSTYVCELGANAEATGEYQTALSLYHKAYELKESNYEAVFRYARLCDLRGDEDEALEYYRKIGPGKTNCFINAALNMALLYEDNGDYQQAISCCNAVLRHDPGNYKARLFRRDVEESMQMYYSPEEAKESERMEAILRIPVSDFELSVRSRNCLNKMNIRSLGDLVRKSEQEMLGYKNFGETSLREIKEILNSRGLRLGMIREGEMTSSPYEKSKPTARPQASASFDNTPIDDLELSVRSRKCMERLGIHTIGQLLSMSEMDLISAKNFGRVSLQEIKQKLTERSLSLR